MAAKKSFQVDINLVMVQYFVFRYERTIGVKHKSEKEIREKYQTVVH